MSQSALVLREVKRAVFDVLVLTDSKDLMLRLDESS